MDKVPSNPKFSSQQQETIDLEIAKLLNKGVIKECEHENGEFIFSVFVTPPKDTGYRLILNLKDLNKDVEFCQFNTETFADILKLVKSNCYMASLDIKDVYYTIPVAEEYQKYLKFMRKDKLYKFCVCPIGCHLVQDGLQNCLSIP